MTITAAGCIAVRCCEYSTRRGTLPFAPTPIVRAAGASPASVPFLKSCMGTGSSPFQPGNLSVSSIYLSDLFSCQKPIALHQALSNETLRLCKPQLKQKLCSLYADIRPLYLSSRRSNVCKAPETHVDFG